MLDASQSERIQTIIYYYIFRNLYYSVIMQEHHLFCDCSSAFHRFSFRSQYALHLMQKADSRAECGLRSIYSSDQYISFYDRMFSGRESSDLQQMIA